MDQQQFDIGGAEEALDSFLREAATVDLSGLNVSQDPVLLQQQQYQLQQLQQQQERIASLADNSMVASQEPFKAAMSLQQSQEQMPTQPLISGDVDLMSVLNGLIQESDEGIFEPHVANGVQQMDATQFFVPHQAVDVPVQVVADPYLFESTANHVVGHQKQQQQEGNVRAGQKRRTNSRSSDEGISMSPATALMSQQQLSPAESMATSASSPQATYIEPLQEETSGKLDVEHDVINSPASDSNIPPMYKHDDAPVVMDDGSGKCPVCREKAGKHSYYGGRVCPSCRAFFRRAVQSKYYEIFFCTKGENCEINLKTRKSCQYCRFKKCLDAGMRIAWVLPDGERHRRFNKLGKTQYRNEFQAGDAAPPTPPKPTTGTELVPLGGRAKAIAVSKEIERRPLTVNIDQGLMAEIHKKGKFQCASFQGALNYLALNPDFLRDMVAVIYYGGSMDYGSYRKFNQLSNMFYRDMMLSQDEFQELSESDKQKLIKGNFPIMNQFKAAFMVQGTCLPKIIHKVATNGQFPDIADKLSNMSLEDAKLSYIGVFSSPFEAEGKGTKCEHYRCLEKIRAWPRQGDKDSPMDDVQVMLMGLILAFSADFLDLDRRDVVERHQSKFVNMLYQYLVFKFGREEAVVRMGNGMQIPSVARRAFEILETRKKGPNQVYDWQ